MLKKFFVAAAIVMSCPALACAQDIFWSFSPTEVVTTSEWDLGTTVSAYIFSEGLFGFDAIDLEFTTSDSDVVRFTGGEAFNPVVFGHFFTRFDFTEITVDAAGSSGGLFSVNVTQFGVNPPALPLFDPTFLADAGPNGAIVLARVDFDVVGAGAANLEFVLGPQGILDLPDIILNPSFGSASLTVGSPKVLTCPGDVDFSGVVDASDIAPFIELLSFGEYQVEADCNFDGVVSFQDIAPFIKILKGN